MLPPAPLSLILLPTLLTVSKSVGVVVVYVKANVCMFKCVSISMTFIFLIVLFTHLHHPTHSHLTYPTAPYGTGKDALFKPLNEEDVKFYTGKVLESKKRVDKIQTYLDKKQWEEVRSELTRQMYDLRRSGEKLADSKQSPEARNALKSLFTDIEDLTVTSRRKQPVEAQAAYNKAKVDFDAFLKAL